MVAAAAAAPERGSCWSPGPFQRAPGLFGRVAPVRQRPGCRSRRQTVTLFASSVKIGGHPPPPPQITHQHPHDVAPKLGEAVGQSGAVRPRLVGRRSGALITFHPVRSRCFLPGKTESKPREQAPDCQQWTGRRCQGCCSYTKLLWTQRGSAPTSFTDRAAKRRKRSATARGS